MTHADVALGWPTDPSTPGRSGPATPSNGVNGHNPTPRDIDAERAVLGAMLLSNQAIDDVAPLITSADFHDTRHATIYAAITAMAAAGRPVDPLTVAAFLAETGDLARIGGGPALHTLIAAVPTVANATYYAHTVARTATARRLQETLTRALHRLHDGTDEQQIRDELAEQLGGPTPGRATPTAVELDQFLQEPGDHYDWLVPGLLERGDRVILTGAEGKGKALATDTPILTDRGWVDLADVKVGDRVWHPSGQLTEVVAATPVMHDRPCYRVTFDDGAELIADANHLWRTETLLAREAAAKVSRRGPTKPRGTDQQWKRRHWPAVVTTTQIADSLRARGGHCLNHAIPLTEPLVGQPATLPVDPYVLGAWLGDGHTDAARITCADPEIIDEVRRAGEPCRPGAGRYLWSLSDGVRRGRGGQHGTLQARLRALGVLGAKHIPPDYLAATYPQRLALLQGLMDTDGTVGAGGRCELSVCDHQLATDALELLRGMGIRVNLLSGPAKLDGRTVGQRWRLAFQTDLPVFRLPRKAARLGARPTRRHRLRYIADVEPVSSVPVRCIQVAAPDGMYLAGRELVPTHNSTLLRQVAVQLAAGIHPFTLEPIDPVRVLYVDLENTDRQVRRKMRALRLQAGEQYQPTPGLHIRVRTEGLDLLDADDAAWLTALAGDIQPDLLITGPIYKLAGGDPTAEEPAKAATRWLDRLRVDVGCALLIEAHTPYASNGGRRPERPYGASLWSRWPEFGLYLAPEGKIRQLRHWRGARDERQWPGALTMGGEWPWMAVTNDNELYWVRIVEECEKEGDQLSERELSKRVGAPKTTIHRIILAHQPEWAALASTTQGDLLQDGLGE